MYGLPIFPVKKEKGTVYIPRTQEVKIIIKVKKGKSVSKRC